jgi:hypothetical protein
VRSRKAASCSGNERDQLRKSLAATPAQRLAWLEAALAIAYQSGAPEPVTAGGASGEEAMSPDPAVEGGDRGD